MLLRFMIASILFVSSSIANPSDDFVYVYRMQGIDGIKRVVDEKLRTKTYWDEYLKNIDTSIGYYENTDYVFIANKKMHNEPNMSLYKIDKPQGKIELLEKVDILIGKGDGDKRKRGDKITPIGAYDILSKKRSLPEFYGPLALVTSYPDVYDRVHNRTGYGIWIHGKPLSGKDRDIDTKGCIAVDNNIMLDFDKFTGSGKIRLITWNEDSKDASKEKLAIILSSLFKWKKAWQSNDLNKYLSFYSKNRFLRFDKKTFDDFVEYKKAVFDSKRGSKIEIEFSKIDVMPYPNTEGMEMYKASFFETYKSFNYNFSGTKEVYVVVENSEMKIIMEK